MEEFEIIFRDDDLVGINKPYGYFVHRSRLDQGSDKVILPILRRMVKKRVYPIHRLDRKTTGVLLFGMNKEIQEGMNALFRERRVLKKYKAIVRGYTEDDGIIDYALKNDRGKTQEAVTYYRNLQKSEIPISSGKYSTSRFSYVEMIPETGRQHQLRKHMAHIFHPIIGDRPHGCNKQNRFFLNEFGLKEMMLHARDLSFTHPRTGQDIHISANFSDEMVRIANILSIDLYTK